MKILILGGTGAMGTHLVKILVECGEEVYVTSRRQQKSEGNMHYLQGDAHDENFLAGLLSEHWDAIVDYMVYNTVEFQERAQQLLAVTEQYIFFSSSRVYADGEGCITEFGRPRLLDVTNDQVYLATDEYALTKARQENILRQSGRINWTIIRPYITYSSHRLQLGVMEKETWLQRVLWGGSIVFSKDIASHYTTLTYGADVSRVVAMLIGNRRALGRAVHIAGPDALKWEEVLDVYLKVLESELGKRPNVCWQRTSEGIVKVLGCTYQVRVDRLFDRRFDSLLADELCGEQIHYVSMRDGLTRCLTEFLQGDRRFEGLNARYEAWADRVAGEQMPFEKLQGGKERLKYGLCREAPWLIPTAKTIWHICK